MKYQKMKSLALDRAEVYLPRYQGRSEEWIAAKVRSKMDNETGRLKAVVPRTPQSVLTRSWVSLQMSEILGLMVVGNVQQFRSLFVGLNFQQDEGQYWRLWYEMLDDFVFVRRPDLKEAAESISHPAYFRSPKEGGDVNDKQAGKAHALMREIQARVEAGRQNEEDIIIAAERFVKTKRRGYMWYIPQIRRADVVVLTLALRYTEEERHTALLRAFQDNTLLRDMREDLAVLQGLQP